jgi:phosphatidylserine synthase
MIAVAVLCLPFCINGACLTFWEGFLFVIGYGGYVTYLMMKSSPMWRYGNLDFQIIQIIFGAAVVIAVGTVMYVWVKRKRSGAGKGA